MYARVRRRGHRTALLASAASAATTTRVGASELSASAGATSSEHEPGSQPAGAVGSAIAAGAAAPLAAADLGGGHASHSQTAVRRPALLTVAAPCRGYFPARAAAKQGVVRISVRVDANGHSELSRVLIESPSSQGFGTAALACAAALRFSPAVDGEGAAVPGEAKLELLFERS